MMPNHDGSLGTELPEPRHRHLLLSRLPTLRGVDQIHGDDVVEEVREPEAQVVVQDGMAGCQRVAATLAHHVQAAGAGQEGERAGRDLIADIVDTGLTDLVLGTETVAEPAALEEHRAQREDAGEED